ncbi:MAG: hypothetical protein IJS32_03510 [Kiritimatiellae bacterium]|nr:hypothetical protein [Kiritimatiellia bacterium]
MNDTTDKGMEWATRLCENPGLAAECDWTAFDGNAWHCLLCKQPQFSSMCDWSFAREWRDEIGRWYWVTLLGEQPQFADRCDCWADFDETDLVYLLRKQPSLASRLTMEKQSGEVQGMILNADPEALSRCRVDNFSSKDWRRFLLELDAVPGELLDKCPWEKFTGNDWVGLLCSKADFAKYCHWDTFETDNWRELLHSRPEYRSEFNAHSGLKYEDLDVENWEPF